jgi:hypothetical protein
VFPGWLAQNTVRELDTSDISVLRDVAGVEFTGLGTDRASEYCSGADSGRTKGDRQRKAG